MTIEQITAINNAISLLSDISQIVYDFEYLADFKEYTNKYIIALKDSGVDSLIIEHVQNQVNSWIPLAEQNERDHAKWRAIYEDLNEMQKEIRNL